MLGRLAIDELEAAIADCTESLRLRPTLVLALNGRGSAYLKLGQPEGGDADIAQARQLLPDVEERFKHPWQLDQ